jgi:hypothetical protein
VALFPAQPINHDAGHPAAQRLGGKQLTRDGVLITPSRDNQHVARLRLLQPG